jgi:NOL1/NOP2/sun family putative RNA methylase
MTIFNINIKFNDMKISIPRKFKERYKDLPDDNEAFFSCLEQPLPKAFRVNTLKAEAKEVVKRVLGYGMGIKRVPWYPDAFVSDDPEVGLTLEHFLGHIYIQELTSMLPPLVIREELIKAKSVLDACAAPGSKTTQTAALMGNRGMIVANDINYGRIRALKFNLEKTGALNTIITNQDIRYFPEMQFDAVLVDAPCSSEGTTRKNPGAIATWSESKIYRHSNLQKQLILKAFDLLAPRGFLVYSTCTFAPEENEEVIDYLLKKRPARLEGVDIPKIRLAAGITEWGKREFNPEVKKTVRFFPHHNNTGGFFLAKVRK